MGIRQPHLGNFSPQEASGVVGDAVGGLPEQALPVLQGVFLGQGDGLLAGGGFVSQVKEVFIRLATIEMVEAGDEEDPFAAMLLFAMLLQGGYYYDGAEFASDAASSTGAVIMSSASDAASSAGAVFPDSREMELC